MNRDELIKDIVREILQRADEAKNAYSGQDVDYGRLLGFAETLSIIKQEYIEDEQVSEMLNFDIDKKYL